MLQMFHDGNATQFRMQLLYGAAVQEELGIQHEATRIEDYLFNNVNGIPAMASQIPYQDPTWRASRPFSTWYVLITGGNQSSSMFTLL